MEWEWELTAMRAAATCDASTATRASGRIVLAQTTPVLLVPESTKAHGHAAAGESAPALERAR